MGDAGGDSEIEKAISDALSDVSHHGVVVMTSLPEEDCVAAAAHVMDTFPSDTPLILLLPPAAWHEAQAVLTARPEARIAVGLTCSTLEAAVEAMQTVQSGGLRPAVLSVPIHPLCPKVHRMLMGLCRRLNCQVMSSAPGGADQAETLASHVERISGPECTTTTILLSWCVSQDMVALSSE